jgi:hypothetical protein
MYNQPRQRFCTNCGQPLAPGAAFCVACGAQAAAPNQFPPPGTPGQGYPPPYAQAPPQAQDDPLLVDLAAGYMASRRGGNPLPRAGRRPRRPGSRLRGCGCLLLVLAVLAGPFIGAALTHGTTQRIFVYVALGMVAFFFLLVLIGMLATRSGREALSEGCLEAILGGFLGGG